MGFAKYQEDIVSRYVADQQMVKASTIESVAKTPQSLAAKPVVNTLTQRKPHMSSLKKFAAATPRPLPVIVLADTSGSMSENGKIEALNAALKDMVSTFAKESRFRAELQIGLITFGERVQVHTPLQTAHSISNVIDLTAKGPTPMGEAFDKARSLLEDKELIPSRAYRPVLILVSDGQPTDEWKTSLDALCASERGQKTTRLAMAIGVDADEAMLGAFTNDLEAPLFKAQNARDIHRFFRAVTMSVTTRTASQNPDQAVALVVPPSDDDALDLDFT